LNAVLALFLALSGSAYANPPWLDNQDYAPQLVEVKKGTITLVESILNPVTIQALGSISVDLGTGTLTTQGNFSTFTVSVAVSGGTGETPFSSTGTVKSCGLIPPLGATYDFEVVTNDADEYPAFGKGAITGRAGINGDWALLGAHKMRFNNATIDGTYKARCLVIR
jgi:hypothetical protein